MKISDHISYSEAIKSNTATRRGIDNTPGDYEITNMVGIAENIFEPLRKWVGGPIKINSMFRCEELNTAIGGSSRSQHCQGRAIDVDDTFGNKTNAEMFNYIKENYEPNQALELERRLLNSIKGQDASKFTRGIRRLKSED